MTIPQLRYFCSVCETLNVTRSAEDLHVSQPSVSNAIRALEEELGIQLFYRTKNRLSPTREGNHYYSRVMELLDSLDRLNREMSDLAGKRNVIRIGVPPMIGAMLFPEMMLRFHELYPDSRIEVTELGSLICQSSVLEETLDLAIVVTNDIDPGKLCCLPLTETSMVLCVSDSHRLSAKSTVSFDDFKGEPLVLMPEGTYNRNVVESLFKSNSISPNVMLYSSQLLTIEQLLENGAAAFLFDGLAEMLPRIRSLPISPPLQTVHIGLIWKQGKHLYADAAKFIGFAEKYHRTETG